MYVAWAFMNFAEWRKMGDSEFAPLWSDYDKSVYYNTYDVTSQVKKGGNASESCWEMDFTMCKAAAIVNCKSVSALPRFVFGWW